MKKNTLQSENHSLPFEGFRQAQLCVIRKYTLPFKSICREKIKNGDLRSQIAADKNMLSKTEN